VIKNKNLLAELRIYNPDINKDDFKGDMADAMMHCVWELVGGLPFLKEEQRKQQTPEPQHKKSPLITA
jgi:hypothetical protein